MLLCRSYNRLRVCDLVRLANSISFDLVLESTPQKSELSETALLVVVFPDFRVRHRVVRITHISADDRFKTRKFKSKRKSTSSIVIIVFVRLYQDKIPKAKIPNYDWIDYSCKRNSVVVYVLAVVLLCVCVYVHAWNSRVIAVNNLIKFNRCLSFVCVCVRLLSYQIIPYQLK